jgi:hypothetical protein
VSEDCRISTDFLRHPKTRKLKRRLGTDGVFALLALWLFTSDAKSDGDLSGMSDEEVELAADWEGEPGALIHALTETRFLDGVTGSYSIHNWAKRNPFAAARGVRIEAARKAAVAKWQKRKITDATGMPSVSASDADRMREGCASDAVGLRDAQTRNAPSPPTTPTSPTPEVKSMVAGATVSASPTPQSVPESSSAPSIVEDGPALALSPLEESDWSAIRRSTPTEDQVEKLYKLYPLKVGKFDAKKAIRKAVVEVQHGDADHPPLALMESLNFLAERLQLYAKCVDGGDRHFLPHPKTWFNTGRFWDDPKTWKVERSGGKKPSNNGLHGNSGDYKNQKVDYVCDNSLEK